MIRYSFWTIVFLVILRVAIGWHFFYEGLNKVLSHYGYGDKPFSSAAYFHNATGPLGELMREQIGDPNAEMLAKVRIKALPTTDPAEKPASLPDPLAERWNAYHAAFIDKFDLSPEQVQQADQRLEAAKEDLVDWLATDDRPVNYELKLQELDKFLEKSRPGFVNPSLRDKIWSTQVETVQLRNQLQNEIDDRFANFQEDLATVLQTPLPSLYPEANPGETIDQHLLDLFKLKSVPEANTPEADYPNSMPKPLADRWQAYVDKFKEIYLSDSTAGLDENARQEKGQAIDDTLRQMEIRLVRWLMDKDPLTAAPITEEDQRASTILLSYRNLLDRWVNADPNQRKMIEEQLQSYRERLDQQLLRHIGWLQTDLDLTLEPAQYSVMQDTDDPQTSKPKADWGTLDWLDWLTRWGLTAMGACLMIGLFTRLACLAAAGFLLLTYLTISPFPWLPESPMTEGNYFFVNKNLIEMLALLVLATTPSGRWLGLDALFSYLLSLRRREGKRAAPTEPVA